MRISFDLDDTLICYGDGLPREPRLPWHRRLLGGDEPLRRGARVLLNQLRDEGWELWIYTTSLRSPRVVRRWLRYHGIIVAGVVNQDVHEAHLKSVLRDHRPSKNPAAFGIALHVDDSEGVRMEGAAHGFEVVVVAPHDEAWTEKVRHAAREMMGRRG